MTLGEKMQKKLLIFDVDGTLFDNSKRQIPLSTIKALKLLKANGHELAVATGRAYFMLYAIDEIKALFDHFVLINGQHIIANNKVIYEDTVEKAKLDNLIASMIELNITYGFQSSDCEAISELNDNVKKSFVELDLNFPPENKNFHEKEKVYQMWCFGESKNIKVLAEKNPDFEFVKWVSAGYDIIKKGQSKGRGIDILKNHLGIDKADIIAFGDGDNDIEMMKAVGIGIAMGNGTPGVKEAADYVTTNIDDDGIYKALKHLCII